MSSTVGKIVQVIGPVIDVSFEGENVALPKILDALEITHPNGNKIIVECQKHVGEDTIRAISMDSTDGLKRGMKVVLAGFGLGYSWSSVVIEW